MEAYLNKGSVENRPVAPVISRARLSEAVLSRFVAQRALTMDDIGLPVVRLVNASSEALVQFMEHGTYDDVLDEEMAVAGWLAVNTLPISAIDELQIIFVTVAASLWSSDRMRAVEAATRVSAETYEGFWPFEHPAAVQQAARFGSLADRIPAPVFLADSGLCISFASPELEELVGDRRPVRGMTLEELFGEGPWSDSALQVPVELTVSGNLKHLEVTVVLMETLDDVEFFGFVRDRTREAMLEEIRDGVVGSISHELRTPLTAIIGYLDLLKNGVLRPEESSEALGIAKSEADLLLRLVADIVDFSKFTSGTAELQHSRFLVAEQVDAAVRRVFQSSNDHVNVDVAVDLYLVADADRVAQVLTNLLTNAKRYGGPNITVSAERSDTSVIFEVSDDGHGIPADEISHIFQPFVQGTARHTGEGAGLGLAICSGIVSSHGGAISVRNDGGARFRVSIPNGDTP